MMSLFGHFHQCARTSAMNAAQQFGHDALLSDGDGIQSLHRLQCIVLQVDM